MNVKAKMNKGWFHDRLADKQISQRKFAKMIGLDPARMSETFSGKRRLQMDEAIAFASIVGVTLDEVIMHAGLELPSLDGKGMCTVVGTVGADGELHTGNVGAPRKVPVPPEAPSGIVAARLVADSLDGWVIYYVDGMKRVPAEALGQLCVAWVAGRSRALLGVLKRGHVRGTHRLEPFGMVGSLVENVAVDRAAPVLWVRTSA